ncbi:MAG: hypothetical protein IID32_05945 [Planctomycetes bacterium]|nr:hypothetical protein [Planctomycetota bacterium]
MFSKSSEFGRAGLVFVAIVSTLMAVVLLGQQVTGKSESPESDNPANVISFAVELSPGHQGIAVIDRENYTLCLYEYNQRGAPHERFVLLAVRSFRYDRMLEDYNNAQPRPDEIKERVMRLRRAVEDGAAVDVAKKASLAEEN